MLGKCHKSKSDGWWDVCETACWDNCLFAAAIHYASNDEIEVVENQQENKVDLNQKEIINQ